MAITYQQLADANATIKTVPIKGKEYAQVPERVRVFRMLFPEGTIETEIISLGDGVVVMKATAAVDGKILATGTAYEKEDSSFINKTSYIENCETSAVGRALGNLGIGSELSIASYEEVTNAINNQDKAVTKATAAHRNTIQNMAGELNIDIKALLKCNNIKSMDDLTADDAARLIKTLGHEKEKRNEGK